MRRARCSDRDECACRTRAIADVDALVFDAYGTLFDVHSVAALAEALAPGRGAALSQLVAHEAARIHVARKSLMATPGAPRERLRRRHRARARLRAGGARPSARRDAERAAAARCLSDARAVSGRARRARSAGAAAALDPVQRHARDARRRWCAAAGSTTLSTACCPSTRPASTSRRPRVYAARGRPAAASGASASASCRRTAGMRSAPRPSASPTFWINRAAARPVDRHGPAPIASSRRWPTLPLRRRRFGRALQLGSARVTACTGRR